MKKIEEKYKELSELEHIIQRPGMYIGSVREEEQDRFVYNKNTGKLKLKTVRFIPGMLKVVDEVIANSCDEYRRKDNMGLDSISVSITDSKTVSVKDNGGIPVVKHKDAGVYVPEFIFGRLRTSSNYSDDEDRNVIGTNGVGSALCNVMSKCFSVTTCDKKNKVTCVWENNMRVLKDTPKPVKCKDHYTLTEFDIDFSKFDTAQACFSDDFKDMIHKRCIDAAAANPGLSVTFSIIEDNNTLYNENWKFKNFEEYIDLYSDYINIQDKISFKNSICTAFVFPESNIDVAFVNGAECSKGTHIRALRTEINSCVADFLNKKDKIELSPKSVDNKYSVFSVFDISNPSYDSQTKDTLTTPVQKFSKNEDKKWEIPQKFLKDITSSEIIGSVRDWYKQKAAADDQKTLRKLNSEAKKGLKRPDKYITCSSKKKSERELWIFEGDSARAGFRSGRIPSIQAGYTMRGVPKNTYGLTPVQIMKNEVFNDIVTILGLKWGKDFSINDLNFGKIVIGSDMDTDGDKIASLLIVFFNNWPELFERSIVVRSESPIITARKGKDTKVFYTLSDFKKEEKKLKGYSFKYTKGLGGLNMEETKNMYQSPRFIEFKKDTMADSMMRKWFLKGDSDTRKEILGI